MAKEIGIYLDSIMNAGGIGLQLKRGTIDFMEDAYQELTSDVIKSIIGGSYQSTLLYIISGCFLSSTGGNTTVQAGAIFYGGEIYRCVGQTFTNPTSGNVVVANLNQVSWQPTDAVGNKYADPQQFIGTGNSNIHIDRTVVFATGAPGSGTLSSDSNSDYANIVSISGRYSSSSNLNGSTLFFYKNYTYNFSSTTNTSGTISFLLDFTRSIIGDELIIISNIPASSTVLNISNSSFVGLIQVAGLSVGAISSASNLTLKIKIIGYNSLVPIILTEIYYN